MTPLDAIGRLLCGATCFAAPVTCWQDLFSLQDLVVVAVVAVLHGTFHTARHARSVDVEATDVAMRIRDLLNTPTFLRDHGGRELVARLEASITPQSAEAWALVATAQAAARWTADESDESRLRQQSQAAIERALAIDPWCADATRASTDRALFMAHTYRQSTTEALGRTLERVLEDVKGGRPRFSLVAHLANLGGDLDTIFDAMTPTVLEPLRAVNGRLGLLDGLAHLFLPVNARLRQSPRFVELCRALGLVEYWETSGRWPDCTAEVAPYYDFIEEARRTLT